MTPGEFRRQVEGYEFRRDQAWKRDANHRIELAWLTAVLVRQKTIPELETLLTPREQKHPEQVKHEYEDLKKRLGG